MKKSLRITALFFVMLLSVTMILPASAAERTDGLKNISYYGDLSACKMTTQQAEAFAAAIQSEGEKQRQYAEKCMEEDGDFDHAFDNQVAFADAGNGVPVMLFFSSLDEKWTKRGIYGGDNSLWQWKEGKVERFLPPTGWLKQGSYGDAWTAEDLYCHLYSDHVLVLGAEYYMYGQIMNLAVFPFHVSVGRF